MQHAPRKLSRLPVMVFALIAMISAGLWRPVTAQTPPIAPTPQTPATTQVHTVYLSLVSAMTAPPAQVLIQRALAEGRIDNDTALLYRFYAMYDDPRLPAGLRGSGSSGEDASLWMEATQPAQPIDPAIARQLHPFLVRPDHPDSVFSEAYRAAFNAQPQSMAQPADAPVCTENGWMGIESAKGYPIKVWAQCALDEPANSPSARAAITKTLALMEHYYQPMVDLMGPPVLDSGGQSDGGSKSIDIYLLHPRAYVIREGVGRTIPEGSLAAAYSAPPRQNNRASGLMILNRTRLNEATFIGDLIHEFFHILQSAHNDAISFRPNPNQAEPFLEYWFVEASAKWAEAHFDPEHAALTTHHWFRMDFQYDTHFLSLHARLPKGESALYAAYIWPFFMSQEAGPQQIAETWRRLEQAGNWDQADQAIDSVLPFGQHFRDFALRNLNLELLPGNPITPRYQDYVRTYFSGAVPASAAFPDDLQPKSSGQGYLGINAAKQQSIELAPLSARYYFFLVADTARQVTLDAGALGTQNGFGWDAVVQRRDGSWEVKQLPSTGYAQLCDIRQFYLITSNSLVPHNQKLEGALTLTAREAPCGCEVIANQLDRIVGWQARVRVDYNASASDDANDISTLRSMVLTSTLGLNGPTNTTFVSGSIDGNAAIHHRHLLLYPEQSHLLSQIDGDGQPTPYDAQLNSGSRISLGLNLARCTYVVNAAAFVAATIADDSSSFTGIAPVGMVGIGPRPLDSLTLSGSATLPAHSNDYIYQEGLEDFFTHNQTFYMAQILGENGMGVATVSWQITPIFRPE